MNKEGKIPGFSVYTAMDIVIEMRQETANYRDARHERIHIRARALGVYFLNMKNVTSVIWQLR